MSYGDNKFNSQVSKAMLNLQVHNSLSNIWYKDLGIVYCQPTEKFKNAHQINYKSRKISQWKLETIFNWKN